jgi:hypothetical protein
LVSAAVQHAYDYGRPSTLAGGRLDLATSRAPAAEGADPFLRARVLRPRLAALVMRLVSDVVRSRHHIPAAMLERILLQADPVLTWGGGVLRVEGFSSCCGMYARADLSGALLAVSEARPGTTNVDFNAEMRAALAQVRDGDALELAVGGPGVALTHEAGGSARTVLERKVKLPSRWLRGFLEVQAIQRRMEPRLELDRAAAVRFLRGLPRAGRSSAAVWVIPSGRSARLGAAPREGAVRVAGLSRLRALEAGLSIADKLVLHEDPRTGASAWCLAGDGLALTVVLSPETWRGFSGEGQTLSALAATEPRVARVRAMLAWQSELTGADVAARAELDGAAAEAAMAWLAARGLVGYDLSRSSWFHRVLPFDLEETRRLVHEQQPRLEAARELVAAQAVRIAARSDEGLEAEVRSQEVVHRVRWRGHEQRCTCTWFAQHQGERGPCKHVLAVELALQEAPAS